MPKSLRAFLLLSIAFVSLTVHGQTCGGTERWQVKVGTDSGVGNVQLQPVVQTTLQDAIHLPQPTLPGDNDTRLPEETHVYQLRGHLVRFKQESNDNDYHLVITDDSLQFTNDAAHHGTGHSLIAEVPDPNCIPGQHGDPNVPSRFITQITCTRNKMDAQFPNADRTGKFNDVGDVPVTITGVGFFDRPHNQTGRASNNLEIHSLLDIDFADGQPSCFQGGLQPSDFTISATPTALTLAPGGTATASLAVNPVNGFTGTVSFSVLGLPTGVTSDVSPASPGGSTLTLTAGPSANQGSFSITVTGSAGSISHTISVPLTVGARPAAGKWEYKLITAPTPEALLTQVNTLGAQGWELAGVAFDSSRPDSYVAFMKRAVTQ